MIDMVEALEIGEMTSETIGRHHMLHLRGVKGV